MKYIKLNNNPDFWLIDDDGRRHKLRSYDDVIRIGLLPVHTVSPAELESYPLATAGADEPGASSGEADE